MSTPSVRSYRINWLRLLIVFGLLLSPIIFWFVVKYPEWNRRRVASQTMELAILRLSLDCPAELSEAQWAYYIEWTLTLHGNFGSSPIPGHVPTDDLERIADELNRQIDKGADRGTIDWIWGEYSAAYPRAARYDSSYRPTGDQNKEQFDLLKANELASDSLQELRMRYQQTLVEFQEKR